jgi:hypothetical protein
VPELVSSVRRAAGIVRYEWLGVRIGGHGASMKGQWPTLLVTAALVFGCFFAIGRLGSGGASRHEASSSLGAFSSSAAIPGELRGGSPIAGSVPSAIATQPSGANASAQAASAARASSAATPAQPLAEGASRTLAPTATTPAVVPVQPATTEAPAPASPKHSSASVQPSSSAGGSHPSPSSGGSFDSSE